MLRRALPNRLGLAEAFLKHLCNYSRTGSLTAMSHSLRYVLAYLWIVAIGTFAPILIASRILNSGKSSSRVPPYVCQTHEPKCQTDRNKRMLTQEQLDIIVKNHQKWLKLDDEQKKSHGSWWADLHDTDLQRLDLNNKDLRYANLTGSEIGPAKWGYLRNTDFAGATMICADLQNTQLKAVSFVGAHLEWTKLCDATLSETHLERVSLLGANLSGAALENAKMAGASLGFVDLADTHFEIDLNSFPDVSGLAMANNLRLMRFEFSPASLSKIRDQLKAMGLREQEKEITSAIRRAEMARTEIAQPTKYVHGIVERIFNKVLFDWTCDYGNAPGRSLEILGMFLLLFAFIYVFAQQWPGSRGGIWAVWDERRIHLDEGSETPTLLTDGFPRSHLSNTRVGQMSHMASLNILGLALWFSLLSASQIGWQAFNFGIWFTRMQPREYSLRATGWVRVASGFQSLISVYLLALWILTYFGTPFE